MTTKRGEIRYDDMGVADYENDKGPHYRETRERRDPYDVNKNVFCKGSNRYAVRNDMTAEEIRDCIRRQTESLPKETMEEWVDSRFAPDTSNYDSYWARPVTVYESPPVRNTVLGCRRRW
jgi:hypothetical protein